LGERLLLLTRGARPHRAFFFSLSDGGRPPRKTWLPSFSLREKERAPRAFFSLAREREWLSPLKKLVLSLSCGSRKKRRTRHNLPPPPRRRFAFLFPLLRRRRDLFCVVGPPPYGGVTPPLSRL